ncbi:MAG: methyltransferase domain-containing protein, partial [Pseudomonadota bacterium]
VSDEKALGLQLTALDYADISQAVFYAESPEVTVLSNTNMQAIPVADLSLDLVVSQFGYEYSDTKESSVEIARILKPSGKFVAMLHHIESEVTQAAERAIQQILWCQRSDLAKVSGKLLKRLAKLEKHRKNPQTDSTAAEFRDQFNKTAERLQQYGDSLVEAAHISYFLNELTSLFNPNKTRNMGLNKKLSIIEQLEKESEDYLDRMEAMLNASSDQNKIDQICEQLSAAGLTLGSIEKMQHEDQVLAWIVQADKAS